MSELNEITQVVQDYTRPISQSLLALSGGREAAGKGYDLVAPKAGVFYARYTLHVQPDGAVIDDILSDAAQNHGPGIVGFAVEQAGAAWAGMLEARGFTLLAIQAGMYRDLHGYVPRPSPENIVRVGADRIDEWSDIGAIAFPKPSEITATRLLADDPAYEFYACLADGRIASTLLGCTIGGVYGIHEVATLPAYRGRGYCEALVHHAFMAAQKAGMRYVVLQGSPLGQAVYERCGMQSVCTIRTYLLPGLS